MLADFNLGLLGPLRDKAFEFQFEQGTVMGCNVIFFSCLGLWPCRGNWNSRSPWKSGVSMVKTPQCHSVYDSTYLELRLCSESWGGGAMKSTNHLDARNLVSNVWGHSTSLISKSLTMHAMQLSYSGGHLLKVKINSLFFFSHKLICFHVFLY